MVDVSIRKYMYLHDQRLITSTVKFLQLNQLDQGWWTSVWQLLSRSPSHAFCGTPVPNQKAKAREATEKAFQSPSCQRMQFFISIEIQVKVNSKAELQKKRKRESDKGPFQPEPSKPFPFNLVVRCLQLHLRWLRWSRNRRLDDRTTTGAPRRMNTAAVSEKVSER